VLVLCLCCGALQAEAQTLEAFFETQVKSLDEVEYPQVGKILGALSSHRGIEPQVHQAIYLPGSGSSLLAVVIPLRSPFHNEAALYLYYYPETGDHFLLQISTDLKGAPEVRLWGAGQAEILVNENGLVLLPRPSDSTFRLPAAISKELTPREILDCIAVFLGISLDFSSLENLLLSTSCSTFNAIALGLTATNCLSIAGVGPNLAFATLGCVTGIARLISCGILNCTTSACNLNPGHADFCRADKCGPCAAGEGDCDGNRQCQSDLTCANDVGANYGWARAVDVCEHPPPPPTCNLVPGHFDFCRPNRCGPCAAGEGDCDGNQECQAGLTCVNNVGLRYGWFLTVDVCE
jgi:hypothetical protein